MSIRYFASEISSDAGYLPRSLTLRFCTARPGFAMLAQRTANQQDSASLACCTEYAAP